MKTRTCCKNLLIPGVNWYYDTIQIQEKHRATKVYDSFHIVTTVATTEEGNNDGDDDKIVSALSEAEGLPQRCFVFNYEIHRRITSHKQPPFKTIIQENQKYKKGTLTHTDICRRYNQLQAATLQNNHT